MLGAKNGWGGSVQDSLDKLVFCRNTVRKILFLQNSGGTESIIRYKDKKSEIILVPQIDQLLPYTVPYKHVAVSVAHLYSQSGITSPWELSATCLVRGWRFPLSEMDCPNLEGHLFFFTVGLCHLGWASRTPIAPRMTIQ